MASTSGASAAQALLNSWPGDPAPPVGYLSRKALPIKRNDAEPLTREDVQYDLLDYIFSDKEKVFTSPYSSKLPKVTFGDLYISALSNSGKCSKVLKDKMVDTPAFALELAKISLLTNVGRINTTMAFFPEMKTALRTYHPVPSLQKTDGNAQDAPRIKNCLKAALLPAEAKSIPPSTPEEILEKRKKGQRPPTSVVNLVFVLANHAAPLASIHFDGVLTFLDLFLPRNLSSSDRGRAFLWHIYHYIEDSEGVNPYDDEYSRANRGKAPLLRQLNETQMAKENVDTDTELAWGKKMSTQRNAFLQKLVSTLEQEKRSKSQTPHFVPEPTLNARRIKSRYSADGPKDEAGFMYYVPTREPSPRAPPREVPQPIHAPPSQPEERSMLQQAWHSIMNANSLLALVDSDEEQDEHKRIDYTRRLNVISRIITTQPPPPPPES
ncbi:hypothetical protein BDN72DRAFT_17464 [Pluteus cervinus]|uniref:Uncharacterized protein n=1 Tax=Pluteus cervinus TaxID=181527 RepID=A0ACD3BGA4_9AGAR|nr:hypothetical protein BDN72DRAFT_17464 [Pluteus cervinus]